MSNEKYESVVVLEEPEPVEHIKEPENVEEEKEEVAKIQDIVVDILDLISKDHEISSIKLSKSQIDIINTIISNSPSLIKDINNGIISIVKDGHIDALDIPQLIILIKDFYTFCHQEPKIKISIKELVTIIAPIIKYIIHIILNKNKTDTPELLSCCDKLVDACMEIIELQSSLKTVGCEIANFFSCMQ